MYFSLIIGIAFNADLRSHLITPDYSDSVTTLYDVVKSGLAIEYMPSGTIVSIGNIEQQ